MGVFLYNCFLFLYTIGARFISPWNSKAALWLKGRKNIFQTIQFFRPDDHTIWMHCASLGEFEQGRPLLEQIKKQYPLHRIVLTFFSPSGYEIRKDYKGADIVCYLPMDSAANAKRFLDIVQPALVVWVKYEYWYYYLTEIKKRNIPLLLISGIFREGQPFFKWYGGLYRKILQSFTHLFVQTTDSKKRLGTIGLSTNVTVSGDTRFDRVTAIASTFEPIELIETFCANHPVIVAGSTWPEDEEELDHYANKHPNIKFIIAPHEISEDHLKDIEKLFTHSIRYSKLTQPNSPPAREGTFIKAGEAALMNGGGHNGNANVLIIDNIGMLSRLYKYATITYIGGGFGYNGLHNVLEAAVYGKPIVFGPVYEKFTEAIELIENKAAFSIENALELESILDKLFNEKTLYDTACKAAKEYVQSKQGATNTILHYIQEKRLLTN